MRRDAGDIARQRDGVALQRIADRVARGDARNVAAVTDAIDALRALVGEVVDADQLAVARAPGPLCTVRRSGRADS